MSLRNKVENFVQSPEGNIVVNTAASIAYLGATALLTKKFFPARATFGRAMTAGIFGMIGTALAGCGAVRRERFTNMLESDTQQMKLDAENRSLRMEKAMLEAEITELRGLLGVDTVSTAEANDEVVFLGEPESAEKELAL